jgi:CheY-like chemotaxis protein
MIGMGSARVLLIEDEASDRELILELVALKGRGQVHLTEACDFKTALELLANRPFDLILLDTRLREVTAISALRTLAEQAPNTPVLSHSAFLTAEVRAAAKRSGAWDVASRGGLNQMWVAMSNQMAMTAAGKPSGILL